MHTSTHRTLLVLLLIYGLASLAHFVHNAEFLADYPNLPASWSRAGVYGAWLALTAVELGGWALLSRGHRLTGLMLLALYAVGGLDSLGHYVLAPLSAHTMAMNSTILFKVTAAALVFAVVMTQMVQRLVSGRAPGHDAAAGK